MREVMALAGTPGVEFRRCMPAVHDAGAAAGRKIEEGLDIDDMDVTQGVPDSEAAIVIDRAGTSIPWIKAVLAAALGT